MRTIIMLAACVCSMPGCIAWEIRDEMRTANRQLCDANPTLVHAIHGIEAVNQDIAQTNAQLAQVQVQLATTSGQLTDLHALLEQTDEHLVAVGATLRQTQPKMTSLDEQLERMRVINEVHAQLKDVNAALGPLGKSLSSLGGAMSFLGMGSSGDVLDDGQASAAAPGAGGEQPTATPAAKEESRGGEKAATDDAASMRRELLAGTWVQVFPRGISGEKSGAGTGEGRSEGRVLVLLGDGRYLQAEQGKPLVSGQWKRDGRTATLTPEGAGAAASAGGGEAKGPAVETFELVALSARTLTLRQGDALLVFGRP